MSFIGQCVIEPRERSNQCLCIREFGENNRWNMWLTADFFHNSRLTNNYRGNRWWSSITSLVNSVNFNAFWISSEPMCPSPSNKLSKYDVNFDSQYGTILDVPWDWFSRRVSQNCRRTINDEFMLLASFTRSPTVVARSTKWIVLTIKSSLVNEANGISFACWIKRIDKTLCDRLDSTAFQTDISTVRSLLHWNKLPFLSHRKCTADHDNLQVVVFIVVFHSRDHRRIIVNVIVVNFNDNDEHRIRTIIIEEATWSWSIVL